MGEERWAGEFDLVANVTEVRRAQKDHRTLGGQLIFASPDASVLDILRQLRPHEGFVLRGWREGLDLLNGVGGSLLVRGQRKDKGAIEFLPDLLEGFGEV